MKEALVGFLLGVACTAAFAQSQTAGEFWPTVDAHVQFPDNWRLLAFTGLKKGEDFPYQQLNAGGGLAYQLRKFTKPHTEDVDPDKEHMFVFGGGYERLQSLQSGKDSHENRLALQATAGFRPASRILITDRNRVEFRWVNGSYSTRYRNDLYGEYDITIRKVRLNPYASVEAFYDGATSSWNEEQYTGGIDWLLQTHFTIQTYYLRQNCTTCNPSHLNVGGLALNVFF